MYTFTGYIGVVSECEENKIQQLRFTDSYNNEPWYNCAPVQYVDLNSGTLFDCVAKIYGAVVLDNNIDPGGDKHVVLEVSMKET